MAISEDSQITDISKLTNLQQLHLRNNGTIADISSLTNLTSLKLNKFCLVDSISSLTKLKKLDISISQIIEHYITDNDISQLTDKSLLRLFQLRTLVLYDTRYITNEGISLLSNLRNSTIVGTKITMGNICSTQINLSKCQKDPYFFGRSITVD